MQDWELIVKHIKGETSEEELRQFEDWLKADVANVSLYNKAKSVWSSTGKLSEGVKFDKSQAWTSIQQKITNEQINKPEKKSANNYNTWILRAAAVLIVGLFATWFMLNVNAKSELIIVQTTDSGKVVVMPDSTVIYLNRNSKLSYPKEFAANQRQVEMEGEAFFEVVKNPLKPFVVKNKNFDVRVLGTSFNVSAFNGDKDVTVTVVTGKVAFSNTKGQSEVLVKGDVGVLDKYKSQLFKTNSDNLNFLSWKTKKLEFNNTDFAEVCEAIKNYFGVKIEVKDKNILNCKFTGLFETPDLQEILNVLEKTLNIKTATNNKQIVITGKGC